MGLLELAGEAGRRHDIAGRPAPERPLSPCVISTVAHSPEAIAAAAWVWQEVTSVDIYRLNSQEVGCTQIVKQRVNSGGTHEANH